MDTAFITVMSVIFSFMALTMYLAPPALLLVSNFSANGDDKPRPRAKILILVSIIVILPVLSYISEVNYVQPTGDPMAGLNYIVPLGIVAFMSFLAMAVRPEVIKVAWVATIAGSVFGGGFAAFALS